ncbi:MAG: hypothetical protein FWG44_01600 [Oscillospiraceae bacterium]|nr:hypothetical protein [Oscillospiraceae bacterium]
MKDYKYFWRVYWLIRIIASIFLGIVIGGGTLFITTFILDNLEIEYSIARIILSQFLLFALITFFISTCIEGKEEKQILLRIRQDSCKHKYDDGDCKCKLCGRADYENGEWDGCKCLRCGKEHHDFLKDYKFSHEKNKEIYGYKWNEHYLRTCMRCRAIEVSYSITSYSGGDYDRDCTCGAHCECNSRTTAGTSDEASTTEYKKIYYPQKINE